MYYLFMNQQRLKELRVWREEANAKLEEGHAYLAEAQRRVKEAEERFSLIDQLMRLEAGEGAGSAKELAERMDIEEHCEAILREAGKPLTIGELYAKLLENNVPIPGKGTKANVIARIQRDEGIIRIGRGVYGLPEFGIPEVKPTRRKRKPGRRRSTE
jgi:hypothetical protein